MEIKIAIPDNPVFGILLENREEVQKKYNVKFYSVSEKQCAELMLANRVDAALLSPYGYGAGVGKVDYMIVPGPAFAAVGYTGLASMYFKQGLPTVNSIATSHKDDFLIDIGIKMLAERYDMHPAVETFKGSIIESLDKFDSHIDWGLDSSAGKALDVSEEWFDAFEMPLPIAFWVCRAQEHPKLIEEIVQALSGTKDKAEDHIHEHEVIDGFDIVREGELILKFTEEFEAALDQTIQFLYFHQYLPNISAIKMLGRDDEKPPEIKIDGILPS